MRPQDVRLPAAMAADLRERAQALLELGTLGAEAGPGAAAAIAELAARLENNYPYPDAMYAGQMLKPPAPVAWAAYATAMLLNPNNHALDGGPATAELEREAVEQLRVMLGVPAPGLGHLTSSGTVANLEALWVARELTGGATVLSSAGAHYTHARMCGVLGVEHEAVATDARGRMDLDALADRLARGGVGTVVATVGSTSIGALDDAGAIAGLCADHGARLHVDTAYGGFFSLLADGGHPGVAEGPFAAIARADSVVIDPHKHGLQPYGCGCVLFADPDVGRLYAHDSPYTYFTSPDLHLGEISLECSRAGASAAALWATLRALPLTREGLGAGLGDCRAAALALADRLDADERVELLAPPELDIVCVRAPGADAERAFHSLAADGWHVATLRTDQGTALRCCLLKPEHLGVVDELAEALAAALSQSS
ncbi:MAG TPA: aminotransferase class I/II-fold pyridoxal phosphate-dependent enzyme [Thermoleophilaceae bacterium]|nr:aminotransferase class I/II-fold pyridoxal phosphate-dependent enzyme [Thermoleophilaceae bacterium]